MKFKEDMELMPNQTKNTEVESEDELEKGGDIDLTKKSLKNTNKSYAEMRKPRKRALPMGSIINQILSKDISKRKYGKTIFTDKKQNLKSIRKEKINTKLKAIKRHLKKKRVNMGRTLPNYGKEKEYERNLKMVAVEGLTKLFNAMANIQKESLDEVLKLRLDDKIGRNAPRTNYGGNRDNNRGSKGGFLTKTF